MSGKIDRAYRISRVASPVAGLGLFFFTMGDMQCAEFRYPISENVMKYERLRQMADDIGSINSELERSLLQIIEPGSILYEEYCLWGERRNSVKDDWFKRYKICFGAYIGIFAMHLGLRRMSKKE